MVDLSQNPLFWPKQGNLVVPKSKSNIFIGVGIATKKEISRAVPFDIVGFILSAEFVKRQIDNSQVFLLIADQHAWLANQFNKQKSLKAADNLEKAIEKIIASLNLQSWHVFRASKKFPSALPQSYEKLEIRDVTHFFNNHRCGIKIGWSFSMSTIKHKTDESHFDEKFNLPISSIFTRTGLTSSIVKPHESPYICTDPTTRVLLDKNEDVGKKINLTVKKHLNRITILFEQLVNEFPNKTPLEKKIKAIINQICH